MSIKIWYSRVGTLPLLAITHWDMYIESFFLTTVSVTLVVVYRCKFLITLLLFLIIPPPPPLYIMFP